MIQRLPLVAALLIVESAIVGGMFISVRAGIPGGWHAHRPGGSEPGRRAAGSVYRFVTGSAPQLTIDVGAADVAIVSQAGGDVGVTVPDDRFTAFMGPLPPITATAAGAAVRIVAERGQWSMFGDPRVVHVTVPPATRVTIENAGNISATGLRAEASLRSTRGDIAVDDFAADSLDLTTSDGHLTLHGVAASRLDATSTNGRVEGTGLQVRDGRIVSDNGRITLGFRPGADTVVSAATSNGRIRVSGLAADAVRSDGDADPRDDGVNARTVRVGSGDGRLDVRASNGNINVNQEG